MYSFYYKEPLEAPEYVAAEKVVDCLLNLCDTTTIKRTTSKTEAKKQYIDREKLESALDYLSKNLPEGSYEEWYRIGFALVPLGEEGENYFIKMSLDNPNYSDTETELRKKFEELAKEYDGSVTIGTIFHIAEVQGWKRPVIKFWKVEKNGNVKIIRTRYKRFLESEGYCKYKMDANYLFVRITDNIVEEIESIAVKDFVLDYLYSVPMDEFDEINRSDVIDALIKGVNQFFTNQFLEFLITRRINFNKDTKESGFFYYSNGFAEVNEKRVQFKEYKQLNGRIWKRQIIDRKYNEAKSRSDFEEFLFNVCRKDKNRFAALKSGIGFALHSYKDPNRAKAVIFLDERLSEGAFGRSGKGLLIKAIGHIRNIVTEESRNFNPSKNFAFQRVTADTNIIAFEDLREKFPFDRLFSIITDGLTVEKKNKDEIFIPFSEAPKIIVSSNYSIKGVDDSTVDRQFTIEFSDHYNMKHRPFDEFGKMFFNGWDEEEWNAFYDFMIECLQYYLKNGLVEYEYVNLERKRLIDETCDEFAEFSDDIRLDYEYNKKELCEQFKGEYDDFEKLHQSKFTRWLKLWARIKDYDVLESKSGANRTIIFKTLKKAA
jgi:hypothetical protein